MLLLLASAIATATDPELTRIEELDLVDLLSFELDVATLIAMPTRETPSIVTVLTGAELMRLGARDLADALRLLPSLEPGVDVWGASGFGVRGQWAFEGRMVLVVDGVEHNETAYNSPGTFAAPALAQPYDGWHAPLPPSGRELGLRLILDR